jgi:hypothetical protein
MGSHDAPRFGSLPLGGGRQASDIETNPAGTISGRLSTALKEIFGFDTFRKSQLQAIQAVSGRLALACICEYGACPTIRIPKIEKLLTLLGYRFTLTSTILPTFLLFFSFYCRTGILTMLYIYNIYTYIYIYCFTHSAYI